MLKFSNRIIFKSLFEGIYLSLKCCYISFYLVVGFEERISSAELFWLICFTIFYSSFIVAFVGFFFLFTILWTGFVVQDHPFLSIWPSAISLIKDVGTLGRKGILGMSCFSFISAWFLNFTILLFFAFHCHWLQINRQLTLFFRTIISFIISSTRLLKGPSLSPSKHI